MIIISISQFVYTRSCMRAQANQNETETENAIAVNEARFKYLLDSMQIIIFAMHTILTILISLNCWHLSIIRFLD